MNNPSSASRRPEGGWQPPEDDDFKIVPPPQTTASSPVSSPVSAPPPPMMPPPPPVTYAPPRPASVVAPTPGKVPAPAKNNQRLFLGIGAAVVLLAAVGFFFVYQMLTGNNGGTGPGGVNSGPVPVQEAATAVSTNKWEVALAGCNYILITVDAAQNKLASQTLVNCGMHILTTEPIAPATTDVEGALKYFKRADALTPNDPNIKHQIDLAQRYITADITMRKPDTGGAIDQFRWFTREPEFANAPYADTPTRLYLAYIDSGNGYLKSSVPNCGQAQLRFEQAATVKFMKDTSLARSRLDETIKNCGKTTPAP